MVRFGPPGPGMSVSDSRGGHETFAVTPASTEFDHRGRNVGLARRHHQTLYGPDELRE